MIHEMAHALETRLNIWDNPQFCNAVKATIGDINPMWDAVRDEETFVKPITRLMNTECLVSIYQGRLYDEQVPLVDDNMEFNIYALGDFFSEAYREFILHPQNLKTIQPEIYQYIVEVMK